LKVRVKHVIAVAVAVSIFVLDWPLSLAISDFLGRLLLLFLLLLVSLLFVERFNKPPVLRVRSLANVLGSCLPIASLFLPYSFLGSVPWYALGPWASSLWVPQLIVLGCLLTLFSRFGAVVTIAGLSVWHTPMFFCPASGCPPYAVGPGYWLAWAGAIVSLFGRSWIALPKSVEGRKLLGSILFPVGLVLTILGAILPYLQYDDYGPVFLFPLFMATGFSVSGVALKLLFRPESTIMDRISKALQKPLR